jgi:hypothetical protein
MRFIQFLSWRRMVAAVVCVVVPAGSVAVVACLGTEYPGACNSSAGKGCARRDDPC